MTRRMLQPWLRLISVVNFCVLGNVGDIVHASLGLMSSPTTETKPVIAPHTAEGQRLAETYGQPLLWRRWGPYVSERSWGTVREDYSEYGSAWDFLSHDQARSKAY